MLGYAIYCHVDLVNQYLLKLQLCTRYVLVLKTNVIIAWVAEEQGQAVDHIKYIRNHLESNKAIQYYFGSLAGDLVGKRWTEKDLVTSKGDRIMAKGTSQRLRGRTEIDVRYTGRFGKRFTFEITKKDMDESVGPCHYNPSKEILDLLTPNPSSEYAKEWRDKCYDATKTLQSDCQNI